MKRPAPRSRRPMVADWLGAAGLLACMTAGWALLGTPGEPALAGPRPASFSPPPPSPAATRRHPGPVAPLAAPRVNADLDRNLIAAAGAGDTGLAARLLDAGASVHAVDERGRSALLVAVLHGHREVAMRLLDAGADVNGKDADGNSPFLAAAATGHAELVRQALAHGADPRSTDRHDGTALIAACEQGNTEVVRILLKAGLPVDHVNDLGWSALLEAIVLGDGSLRYEETVQLLLDAGADANLADREGTTPTRHARERGYKTMVRMLMRERGH